MFEHHHRAIRQQHHIPVNLEWQQRRTGLNPFQDLNEDADHDPHWDYNPHRNWVKDEWINIDDDGNIVFGFKNYKN